MPSALRCVFLRLHTACGLKTSSYAICTSCINLFLSYYHTPKSVAKDYKCAWGAYVQRSNYFALSVHCPYKSAVCNVNCNVTALVITVFHTTNLHCSRFAADNKKFHGTCLLNATIATNFFPLRKMYVGHRCAHRVHVTKSIDRWRHLPVDFRQWLSHFRLVLTRILVLYVPFYVQLYVMFIFITHV